MRDVIHRMRLERRLAGLFFIVVLILAALMTLLAHNTNSPIPSRVAEPTYDDGIPPQGGNTP